jgi:hypothetical protein
MAHNVFITVFTADRRLEGPDQLNTTWDSNDAQRAALIIGSNLLKDPIYVPGSDLKSLVKKRGELILTCNKLRDIAIGTPSLVTANLSALEYPRTPRDSS